MGDADLLAKGDGAGEVDVNSTALSPSSLRPEIKRLARGRREVAAAGVDEVRTLWPFIGAALGSMH